jgi:hypothetical protein
MIIENHYKISGYVCDIYAQKRWSTEQTFTLHGTDVQR